MSADEPSVSAGDDGGDDSAEHSVCFCGPGTGGAVAGADSARWAKENRAVLVGESNAQRRSAAVVFAGGAGAAGAGGGYVVLQFAEGAGSAADGDAAGGAGDCGLDVGAFRFCRHGGADCESGPGDR